MIPAWVDRAEYPFEPRAFASPDGTMRYLDEGRGPTVVMVHGTPTWSFVKGNPGRVLPAILLKGNPGRVSPGDLTEGEPWEGSPGPSRNGLSGGSPRG